jgi:hypothetical protein
MPVDCHVPDSAPAALTDLIAAGLISHEVIGDPQRLGPEAETLKTLCGLIGGPVWRVGSFHYAFRALPGDLGGRLAETPAAAWTAALEAALQAELGGEAIWVSPADVLPEGEADLDQPLLLLRAQAEAVSGALEAAPAPLQAVISAGYAIEVARLTAGAGPGQGQGLAARLEAIEAGQARILDALAAAASSEAAPIETAPIVTALARLENSLNTGMNAVLEEVLRRLEAQEAQLAAQAAGIEALAARPDAAPEGGFQETIGLTLAEFLARLETRAEPAPRARLIS